MPVVEPDIDASRLNLPANLDQLSEAQWKGAFKEASMVKDEAASGISMRKPALIRPSPRRFVVVRAKNSQACPQTKLQWQRMVRNEKRLPALASHFFLFGKRLVQLH